MEAIKEILINLPKGIISSVLLSGTLISLSYFIFWKRYQNRFANWRIQIKQRVDSKQIKS